MRPYLLPLPTLEEQQPGHAGAGPTPSAASVGASVAGGAGSHTDAGIVRELDDERIL